MNIMRQETQDKLKQIKGRFRLLMNGVVAQSMRDKGVGYKINWGVGLPALRQMASEYGKDYALAVELWKEDIRECKILATLIMPASAMEADLVDIWVSQLPNVEMAEMAAFNLFRHLDGAKGHALTWLASGNVLEQVCGYNVLSRLFMSGEDLTEREINEFVDQAQSAIVDDNMSVRRAVTNALLRFAQKGDVYRAMLKSAFKSYNLDIF